MTPVRAPGARSASTASSNCRPPDGVFRSRSTWQRPSGFFVDADVPRAVLRLAPAAQWIAEEYPVDSVQPLDDPAGWVEVRLPVTSDRWLSRLLIRLGPAVVAVEPSTAADEASTLARRVLAGYG